MEQRRMGMFQYEYIEKMVKNLPLLRTAAGLTQAQLGKILGTSRQTIVAIENKKRPLPWSLYLAMVLIFNQYEGAKILIETFDLFDGEHLIKL